MATKKTAEELLKDLLVTLRRTPEPHTMFNSAHVKIFGDAIAEIESYFKDSKKSRSVVAKEDFDSRHASFLITQEAAAKKRKEFRERAQAANATRAAPKLTEGPVKTNLAPPTLKAHTSQPPAPPPIKLPKE